MNEHVKKALESALTNARDEFYRYELQAKRIPGLQWALEIRASLREQIAALEAELSE